LLLFFVDLFLEALRKLRVSARGHDGFQKKASAFMEVIEKVLAEFGQDHGGGPLVGGGAQQAVDFVRHVVLDGV
jgi:hypothetical protein